MILHNDFLVVLFEYSLIKIFQQDIAIQSPGWALSFFERKCCQIQLTVQKEKGKNTTQITRKYFLHAAPSAIITFRDIFERPH